MTTAVLTGAAGPLGRRVADALATETGIDVVTLDAGLDRAAGLSAGVAETIAAADVVVDLGSSDYDRRATNRESSTEFASATLGTADLLAADHVVFVSSAMVYGARPNNPVPLVEEAVLRPDVDFVFARQLASAEELVEQWRRARPGRATTVLRPVVALAGDGTSRLAGALVAGLGQRFAEQDPPAQFLHLDDLTCAVVLAVRRRLDGVFNVAPDGWIAGERVRALSGERPRLQLPDRWAELLGRLRWRFQRGPIPPGLRSYTREPWVVSNGRLRAEGWQPTVTNEQAYVEGTEGRWWTLVSPKRRQELALGAAGERCSPRSSSGCSSSVAGAAGPRTRSAPVARRCRSAGRHQSPTRTTISPASIRATSSPERSTTIARSSSCRNSTSPHSTRYVAVSVFTWTTSSRRGSDAATVTVLSWTTGAAAIAFGIGENDASRGARLTEMIWPAAAVRGTVVVWRTTGAVVALIATGPLVGLGVSTTTIATSMIAASAPAASRTGRPCASASISCRLGPISEGCRHDRSCGGSGARSTTTRA